MFVQRKPIFGRWFKARLWKALNIKLRVLDSILQLMVGAGGLNDKIQYHFVQYYVLSNYVFNSRQKMNSLKARSSSYSPLLSQCLALCLTQSKHSIHNLFSLKENIIRLTNMSLEFRRQAEAQIASEEGRKSKHGKGGPPNGQAEINSSYGF